MTGQTLGRRNAAPVQGTELDLAPTIPNRERLDERLLQDAWDNCKRLTIFS